MEKIALTIVACVGITLSAAAADFAMPKEAEAVVPKLIKAIGANKADAFKEVTAKDPKWVHGDLYPFVVDMQATVLAHGANDKLVGKVLMDLEDADGKQFVKEFVQSTSAKGKSWTDYKWSDPVTKKVLPKSVYCEKSGELVVCAGIYKR
ncbi:cache domain-containing protein [Rhodoferax saidenbachensis]|uniref:Signal transduction histidine kinase n=1 Tax=Rhodoferax saidenbachensis TaxID=1484693 RepID=A0ABU1ZSW2_9BURK|nr:cache domain-containing protein [Rhodoferax saidenbachensis]MDR7308649.1 signal transduction histidine kinase [Rhodoferax saidenbachensis]